MQQLLATKASSALILDLRELEVIRRFLHCTQKLF